MPGASAAAAGQFGVPVALWSPWAKWMRGRTESRSTALGYHVRTLATVIIGSLTVRTVVLRAPAHGSVLAPARASLLQFDGGQRLNRVIPGPFGRSPFVLQELRTTVMHDNRAGRSENASLLPRHYTPSATASDKNILMRVVPASHKINPDFCSDTDLGHEETMCVPNRGGQDEREHTGTRHSCPSTHPPPPPSAVRGRQRAGNPGRGGCCGRDGQCPCPGRPTRPGPRSACGDRGPGHRTGSRGTGRRASARRRDRSGRSAGHAGWRLGFGLVARLGLRLVARLGLRLRLVIPLGLVARLVARSAGGA